MGDPHEDQARGCRARQARDGSNEALSTWARLAQAAGGEACVLWRGRGKAAGVGWHASGGKGLTAAAPSQGEHGSLHPWGASELREVIGVCCVSSSLIEQAEVLAAYHPPKIESTCL